MFPEENALERLAGDVAREVVHDHDVGHTLELAGHPGVDPLHEPALADGARPSEDGRRGRRLPLPRVLRDLSAKVVVAKTTTCGRFNRLACIPVLEARAGGDSDAIPRPGG